MESPPARVARRQRSEECAAALARDIAASPDGRCETKFVRVVAAATDRRCAARPERQFAARFVTATPERQLHSAPGGRSIIGCGPEFLAAAKAVELRFPAPKTLSASHARRLLATHTAGSGSSAVAKPVEASVAKFVGATSEIHRRPAAARLERSPAESYWHPPSEKLDRAPAGTPVAARAEEAALFVAAGGILR